MLILRRRSWLFPVLLVWSLQKPTPNPTPASKNKIFKKCELATIYARQNARTAGIAGFQSIKVNKIRKKKTGQKGLLVNNLFINRDPSF